MLKRTGILVVSALCLSCALCSGGGAAEPAGSENSEAEAAKPADLIAKKVEVDTNMDGKPDRFEYYEEGVLFRIEADTNHDGKIDEWDAVKEGKIVKAEKDTDGDERPDRWITY